MGGGSGCRPALVNFSRCILVVSREILSENVSLGTKLVTFIKRKSGPALCLRFTVRTNPGCFLPYHGSQECVMSMSMHCPIWVSGVQHLVHEKNPVACMV